MNDTLSKFLIFAAGAAIGSAVTWKYLKTKYEQEEILEEDEELLEEEADGETTDEEVTPDDLYTVGKAYEKPDIKEYAKILNETNYGGEPVEVEDVKKDPAMVKYIKKEVADVERPYVIKPEEFGEFDEYEQISLTYYADGVLADDMDERVEDVDYIVGTDSLTHFGEYEDDSVFVRNDRMKADYEILLDPRNYTDVVPDSPPDEE